MLTNLKLFGYASILKQPDFFWGSDKSFFTLAQEAAQTSSSLLPNLSSNISRLVIAYAAGCYSSLQDREKVPLNLSCTEKCFQVKITGRALTVIEKKLMRYTCGYTPK